MSFIAIDFEASCLPQYGRSFPIEVGIANPFGWSQSWLIRPHTAWTGWQWRRDAEAVHGIALERLHREGLDAEQVASQLRSAIGDSEVVADSRLDDYWSRTLFDAAGEDRHIPVNSISDWPEFQAVGATRMEAAIAAADAAGRRQHRAENDALWLARLMTELGLGRSTELASINARFSPSLRQLAIAR